MSTGHALVVVLLVVLAILTYAAFVAAGAWALVTFAGLNWGLSILISIAFFMVIGALQGRS